jgi:adenosylcobinamide-GDP ribazoletransferase
MKKCLAGFILALQFFTRLPIPYQIKWEAPTQKWALRWFAFVGLILGLVLTGSTYVLFHTIDYTWVVALIALSLWVLITGGLHLDGWMDVADAAGSQADLEKKWQIMRDPHVGSFGILSLLFLLSWKYAGIYLLLIDEKIFLLILIPVLTRLGALFLLWKLPNGRSSGLAFEWKKHLDWTVIMLGSIPLLLLLVIPHGWLLVIGYLPFIVFCFVWIKRQFKGINGDLVGAYIEGGEVWCLFFIFIYFAMV